MKIVNVKVKNFRSIESEEIDFSNFNILVGQNNHGKTNFFEALRWFFRGFNRMEGKEDLVFFENSDDEISVEIKFTGLQQAISNMTNTAKQTALVNIFGEDTDEITIRRTTEFDDGKKRQLYNPEIRGWANTMGVDKTWGEILPELEYVSTKVSPDEIGGYKSKSPISEMLSGTLTSIIENDPRYTDLKQKFDELFGNEDSEVRMKLDELGGKVEVYLQKQFPDDAEVRFKVEIPEFNDMLKKFSTKVDDGVETDIEEKGDGMQRAVMLSIIQVYADFRKESQITRNFIFLLDEAELHLHPSAQRALKEALRDISTTNDQVFVNTHSSVLVTDNESGQNIYKVEKSNKRTDIDKIETDDEKMDVIFDLLGGSPADLLLPKNFVIVEGPSEYHFIKTIRQRFYPTRYNGIKILFSRGDMNRTANTFHAIHEAYKPLFVDDGIYKERVVILCDLPNDQNRRSYRDFMSSHPWIEVGEQIHKLDVDALEKYYPEPYKKDDDEIQELERDRLKVSYAIEVAENITQEQFEGDMSIVYQALEKAKEKSF